MSVNIRKRKAGRLDHKKTGRSRKKEEIHRKVVIPPMDDAISL